MTHHPERSLVIPDLARLPSGLVPVVSALLAEIESGKATDLASHLTYLAALLAPEQQTTEHEVS